MSTSKKHIHFIADADVAEYLAAESTRTGAPVGEILRRAVRSAKAAVVSQSKQLPRWEGPAVETRNHQPVLIPRSNS